MNEDGQVYADLAEFIPEADRKRMEETEAEQRAKMREFLTAEAETRLREAEDEAYLHGA